MDTTMTTTEWPKGKMFVDWCPVPKQVIRVPYANSYAYIHVPLTPEEKFQHDYLATFPERLSRVQCVNLELLRLGDVFAKYGWEPLTKTVIVSAYKYPADFLGD